MTRHPSAPLRPPLPSVLVPPGWVARSDPARGIVVGARPRHAPRPGRVAPEITLRVVAVAETDLLAWRERALVELSAALAGLEVDDAEVLDHDGGEVAYRRFGHRVGGTELLVEQWAWLADGIGTTLTCSVERDDYEAHADLFEAVAGSVEPGARAA